MTQWTDLEVVTGEEAAPLVFFASSGLDEILGPDAHQGRAAAALHNTRPNLRGGRWLDIVGDSADHSRLVVIGLEPGGGDATQTWLLAGGFLVDAMRSLGLDGVRLPASDELNCPGAYEALLSGALLHGFKLAQGRREAADDFTPKRLIVDAADLDGANKVVQEVRPVSRARAWVEQPANLLTPAVFADEAIAALVAQGVSVKAFGLAELDQMGAGALLAVARASEHEPRLLVAEWRGDPASDRWDAALVGKGLTFDSGGLNLKVRPVIEKMKLDMGGAAAVLGALELAASRHARINVVAIVPMAENVIGGRGFRPGDVVRSLSGLTIEVVNTDAEGRLVLADGITYAITHYRPDALVDVATLTGSMASVLHEEYAGLYASDDDLAAALVQAGEQMGEHLWRMPLSSAQDYLVSSSVADVANLGAPGHLGVGSGSPAAGAKFLERFAKGSRWAHIDMAGPAWATRRTSRSGPGATGFGVALIDRWLAGLEPTPA